MKQTSQQREMRKMKTCLLYNCPVIKTAKKVHANWLIILLLSAISFASFFVTGEAYAQVPLHYVEAARIMEVSEQYNAIIYLDNIYDLGSYDYKVTFHSKLLECKGVSEGGLTKNKGWTFNVTGCAADSGSIHITGNGPGVSGSGSMAIIQFKCLAIGSSVIEIEECYFLDSEGHGIAHNHDRAAIEHFKSPLPCFIATAAYGSYLDPHVQILREFRDQYLLTNPVGERLVSLYYEYSPPAADFINEHPALKPLVRVGLLPAVAMSTVATNTASADKMAILGSLALISVTLAVCLTRWSRRAAWW